MPIHHRPRGAGRPSRGQARRAPAARIAVEALESRLAPAGNLVPRVAEKAGDNDSVVTAQAVQPPDTRLYDTPKDGWLTIDGALDSGADVDTYAITLTKPTSLMVDLDLFTLQKVPRPFLVSMQLLGANGQTILDLGAGGVDFFTGNDGRDPSLYYDLGPGTYTVRLESALDGAALQAAFGNPAAEEAIRNAIPLGPGNYELRVLTDSGYTRTVPVFESNPGAAAKLYLDFDGHRSTGDVWSPNGYTLTPINLSGHGHLSEPGVFTPGELLLYKTIWRSVAENFAPFNVDVTTREPGAFANRVALRNVVADRTSYFLPDFNVGYARLAGFQFEAQEPTHTFLDGRLQNPFDNTKAFINKGQPTGEYVSHEIAHALGLNHGGSTGPTPFEPILPATPPVRVFPQNARTWTVGLDETGGQVNQMDVIAGPANGFGYRADTNNALNTPITLAAAGNGYSRRDVIEKSDDVDYFQFRGQGATRIAVDVEPGTALANLDSVLEVYRAGQATPFLTANPAGTRDAVLQTTLDEGDYVVAVKGIGRVVTPARSFDVVGQYTLTVTTTVAQANQPPAAALPGGAVAVVQNGPAALLDVGATVTDPDSPNFNGGRLTVRVSANAAPEDKLDLKEEANVVELVTGNRVRVRGKVVGERTTGPGNELAFTFTTADATPDAVQELLRHITFATASARTTARTVEVVVSDGRAASPAATKTVNVTVPAPPKMKVEENQGLTAPADGPKTIAAGALRVTSPVAGAKVVYTLTRTPANGALLISRPSGVPGLPDFLPAELKVGDSFTQDDLDNGRVFYRLTPGSTANADGFSFTAKDDQGNALPEQTFAVRVSRGAAPGQGVGPAALGFGLFGGKGRVGILAEGSRVTLGAAATEITLGQSLLNFTGAADPRDLRYDIVSPPLYGTLSLPSSFTQKDVNDNLLTYRAPPAADVPPDVFDDRFVFLVTDTQTGGITDAITFTISFDNPNAPPEFLDGNADLGLIPFFTGSPRSAATTVRDLLRGHFGDPDSLEGFEARPGVAVTRVDAANGRWEYTTDGGETWQELAEVSDTSALLLGGDDGEAAVRYFPNAGFRGLADLGFRLWDQSDGQSGGRADLTTDETGGFSAVVGRAVLVVPAEERAPTFTAGPVTVVNEDAGVVVVPNWATDIQDNGLGDPVTFVVEPSFDDDTASDDVNSDLTFLELPTVGADGTLRFRVAPDSFGSATFLVSAASGTGSSPAFALSITVRPVNDAPSFTAGPDVVVNAGAGPVQLLGWTRDLSAGPANEASQALRVNVTTDNPALFSVLPTLDPATGNLTFTPAAAGSGTARVSINLSDDGGTDDGGQNATTRVLTVTLAAPPAGVRVSPGAGAAWVNQAYRDLLGRDADAAGLTFWTNALAGGADRAQVVRGIQGSVEYAAHQAAGLYRTYLRREADAAGLTNLTSLLANGVLPDLARSVLLSSDEYYATRGGGTADGFLSALYDDVLHRSLDPAGREGWGRALAAGHSRGQVALAVLGSAEADRAAVRVAYQTLLGRAADDNGLSLFAGGLQSGQSEDVFLSVVLASEEYYGRVR